MTFNEILVGILNTAVLIGALVIKIPQISKVLRSKSVVGISESMLILDFSGAACYAAYATLAGLPFMAFGESIFIALQMFVLILLYWKFSKSIGLKRRMTSLAFIYVGIAYAFKHENFIARIQPSLVIASIFLGMSSRLPQIILNFRQGHTGQLALVSFFLSFAGSAARMTTSLLQNGDKMLFLQYFLLTFLNLTLVLQIMFLKE
jgi:mannose-P-dolichol utilization defect 1